MLTASDLIMTRVVLAIHGIRRFNCPHFTVCPLKEGREGQDQAGGQGQQGGPGGG